MTQQSDTHLTTEQLSALLDAQLSQDEQAMCEAHLRTCVQCRARMADLRQTVTLLRALPAPALPRSFALPTNVTYLQERPPREAVSRAAPPRAAQPALQQRRPAPFRRSIRVLSALAAVIGLVFLVPGLLGMLPHGGAGTASSTSSGSSIHASASQIKPNTLGTRPATGAPSKQSTPRTPAATPAQTPRLGTHSNATLTPPAAQSQPIFDPGTPQGQLELGIALLVLGSVGILLTRRRKQRTQA